MNSGSLFFSLLSWFIFIPFYFFAKMLAKIFGSTRSLIVLKYVSNWIFFNYIIRVLLESYLDLSLTALMNLKHINWQVNGETISTSSSLFVMIFLIIFTIGSIFFIIKNLKKIKENIISTMLWRFKAFHEDFNK